MKAILASLLFSLTMLLASLHEKPVKVGGPAFSASTFASSSYIGTFNFTCTPWNAWTTLTITNNPGIFVWPIENQMGDDFAQVQVSLYAPTSSVIDAAFCATQKTVCSDAQGHKITVHSC